MKAAADPLHAYYAARAAEYDRVYDKPERQDDLAALRAWLPGWFQGRQVLELACGTGYWTQFLAPVATRWVGLDAAEETLQIARSRPGLGAVAWRVGDAHALPPALGTFDAAFAGFWFSHVLKSRRAAFLQGLISRLAPGSTVVMIDNRLVSGSSTPVSDCDVEGNTYQLRTLVDGTSHRVLKNFPDEAELLAAAAPHGIDAQVTLFPHYWALVFRTR